MPNFSHINFDEIEPSADLDGFEGRLARKHLHSRDLGVSRFSYAPNRRSPQAHKHREQEEVYFVASGSGRALLGEELVDLRQGDVLRVGPEVVRAFEAGSEGLELIVIGGPEPEGGDGEPVEVGWPS
jgi:mannose-6-phosphate isomerase-like protein (cupin superfamily)